MRRINTENLPVNYGMNALAMFSDERGISMNDVFQMDYEKLNLMDLLALLYAGLRDGARKAGEECKFNDFWYNYTLRELWNAVEGFSEREDRNNREQWEQTRSIYAAIYNKPVYGYKHYPKDIKKIMPLPWDHESNVDQEDIDRVKEYFKQHGK